MSLLDRAMDEVRAGNAVLWELEPERRYVWLTETAMTNAVANPYAPVVRRFADAMHDDRAATREALELEAEEREARDWRSNMERPEV